MSQQLMDKVESSFLKKNVPVFHIGDTVDVHVRIVEGDRERVQVFNGVVIARKGHGLNEMFTVRRIVANEGVERVFMVHSPLVADIQIKRRGKVRRAKLYFLRDRIGKARRLKELRISSARRKKSKMVAEDITAAPAPVAAATEAETEPAGTEA